MKKSILWTLFTLAFAFAAFAQRTQARPEGEPRPSPPSTSAAAESGRPAAGQAEAARQEVPKDNVSTTTHSVTINGETVNYTARAGTIVMKDEDGKPQASFFFVYYSKDGADPAKRPITFAFNGGPGSSSVWLHMGAFGPKRVAYGDAEGHAAKPPYRLVDNENSILDITDIIFIDPVTTGFSRAIPVKEDAKYHGVDGDIHSVGDFIRLLTTRYSRWASPKFLAGESYGTTRAAGLSGYLTEQGYYLNGIILMSCILNFQTTNFATGNDLPYILFLPTYTATAWYHKKLPADIQSGDLDQALAESEHFALGDYTRALMQGPSISAADRKAVVNELARLTGLSSQYVEEANMRIRIDRFDKELLRSARLTAGRLDSRFTGFDRDAAGETGEYDPSYAAIMGEYTAMLNDYVRRELRFETDLPYEILTDRVRPWSFDRNNNRYLDVAETLRGALAQNPYLHVFIANGYYDLATPFEATKYTFGRIETDPQLQSAVSMDFFRAGHMMYIDRQSHAKLKKDISDFIGKYSNLQ